jgi:para-aminobenzoate synthetase/4-amino-4-deoxychorismate lyase
VALLDGKLVTPPAQCGLLPGTFREALIEGGILQERVLTLDDLRAADEILLINSVRGWRKVYLTDEGSRA